MLDLDELKKLVQRVNLIPEDGLLKLILAGFLTHSLHILFVVPFEVEPLFDNE